MERKGWPRGVLMLKGSEREAWGVGRQNIRSTVADCLLTQFGSEFLTDLEDGENADTRAPALETLIQAGWRGWSGYLHFHCGFNTSQRYQGSCFWDWLDIWSQALKNAVWRKVSVSTISSAQPAPGPASRPPGLCLW